MAATALPTAVSGLLAVRQGWAVALDDGAIAVGVHDTLSLHPRLVGLYTSLTSFSGSGTRLHNLGPLEFWLLAVPGRIFGPTGSGLVLGATALNVLALSGIVWLAHRRAGWPATVVVSAIALIYQFVQGGVILHEIWNPFLAVAWLVLTLFGCWSLADGDDLLLAPTAVAASLTVQLHLSYVAPAVCALVWGLVGLAVTIVRARREAGVVRERGPRPVRHRGCAGTCCSQRPRPSPAGSGPSSTRSCTVRATWSCSCVPLSTRTIRARGSPGASAT